MIDKCLGMQEYTTYHCKCKSRARPFGRTGLTGGATFAIDYLYTQRLGSRLSIWPTISGQADIDTFSVIHITASTTSFNCFIVTYNAALTLTADWGHSGFHFSGI